MKKVITLVAAAIMAVGTVNGQDNVNIGKSNIQLKGRTMTPEALWAMGRIGAAEASPDGSRVVFQVGYYSVKQNKGHQVVCVMNADGTDRRQLTTSSKNETDPTWLDSETIAYISGGEIWSMKADGTDRRQLSKTDGKVEGFKFSPDRQKVIVLKSLPFHEIIKENPSDLPKATGRRVTDLMYRHWDHYVESIQHPFVADVNPQQFTIDNGQWIDILDGEPYECPMEPFGGMEQLAWSPDSKQIAYTCRKKTGTQYAISTDSDIYIYDIGTRVTRNLCKPAGYVEPKLDASKTMKFQQMDAESNLKNHVGYDTNPQFSPDGKFVAWLSMERNGYEADRNRLCCYELATGNERYLTESFDSNVDEFVWSDTKDAMIYFIGVWHATENLYAINWKGGLKQMTNTWADFGSLHLMNNKKQLLMERHSFTAPADLYVVTPNFKKPEKTAVVQLTQENKHILDQMDQPTVQQHWVKTTDGKQMLTWVILPPNFDEQKKYPTLLFCEGGPQSPVSQFWSYRWNFYIMSSQGYMVVAPNRRGLPGFGQEWLEQISGDWTGQCMNDYLSAIDFAADSLPFVDRNRLGAVG
ncbi:MAG: S9 family peptidase, partial [Prevotella sp.]|nr:S9 family peptidase [Prevotella sp.]